MTGERLYELYREVHKDYNIETDEWSDLDLDDKDIWNTLAESLLEKD